MPVQPTARSACRARHPAVVAALLLALLLLSACGNKGPLRLPDAPATGVSATT